MMLGEAVELFVPLLPVHLLKQHPIWLLRAELSPWYLEKHGVGLTVGSTKLAKEGGMVFKVCTEPVKARRISHCFILIISLYGPMEFSLLP